MSDISLHYGRKCSDTRTIVIGATGELGGAIARICASRGENLLLTGRDRTRLERIAGLCSDLGAQSVDVAILDLNDLPAALALIASSEQALPTHRLFVASGLGEIRDPGDVVEQAALVGRLGQVNFLAPTVIAADLARHMVRRGCGHIVLVGSAAAFYSLPFAIAYSASKAGLARFADGLRIAVAPHNVFVTLASPGFIDTASARRVQGPKPFLIDVDVAARRIVFASDRGRAHLVTPWPFSVLRSIVRALPRVISDRLLRSLAPEPDQPEA